ncbi:acyl-CoA dehydrogenase family protein [Pseudobacteriovorax antillogorgiicola]|uniref:Putative acyl-CoA dehydrogenase n=2 Tax=Pseudobacteriovorax antillogorgiicola TaxID=1513793 RepID=A0A1Y6BS67_9BACT|nr:acyl-CoA dehydrogenase family protein [Pseudobacteriovorax antillogorgiicola]TCS53191.1 putative acyl-CoA dehydrogenase [Pseudobacteriovorax antillogorgiicola]SMF24436.1 putative acyl-CoA dehydrogenase [Pseudobacteriovorax antillogorgiicola]
MPFEIASPDRAENVSHDLVDYNMLRQDNVLLEGLNHFSGQTWQDQLESFGELCGREETLHDGNLANRFPPTLRTHDHFGNRVDRIEFHPSYHRLLDSYIRNGLHSEPWEQKKAAYLARAMKMYMQTQVEAGHCCPGTMTFAAIPTLRHNPNIAKALEPQILSRRYDPRDQFYGDKSGLIFGMGMTEKQGGSDVRANTTQAIPQGKDSWGDIYEIIGHKFFLSAPMSDFFLVLAQAPEGLSCFLMPRWQDVGVKNKIYIQQLKDKMGNRSNASSEVEFHGAKAWLIGEQGRGVATIINMVAHTRFDCLVSSAGLIRQSTVQAIHHCHQRKAFGKKLVDQDLMKQVLADLALESEAASIFALRVAHAFDQQSHNETERNFLRIATAVGKYWLCKQVPLHTYEAMECLGGSGVMETSMMPRLYREAPINAIWEGCGNIQALDLLRVIDRHPEALEAYLEDVRDVASENSLVKACLQRITESLQDRDHLASQSRRVMIDLALALQASLLIRYSKSEIADAFCSSRLLGSHHHYGVLPRGTDCSLMIARAWPI